MRHTHESRKVQNPRKSTSWPLRLPLDIEFMRGLEYVLYVIFIFLLLTIGIKLIFQSSIFKLHTITVDTKLNRVNSVEIKNNISGLVSGNILDVDLAVTRLALEKTLWVRRAKVQRNFPGKLMVSVEEHQPVAYWKEENGTYMINTYGDVFEARPYDIQDMIIPVLEGLPEQSALLLLAFQRLSVAFRPMNNVSIEGLKLTPQGRWLVKFDNGTNIQLGYGTISEIVKRSERFVATIDQITKIYGRPLESADLRYPNGYSIRLRGIATVSSNTIVEFSSKLSQQTLKARKEN